MKSKKVLIVEDNELNMKLVVALLKMGQYSPLQASDAETGIQLARENNPDLILMDIQLPGMDGLSAAGVIKKDKNLQGIPVVALTSYAMHGDEKRALAAGCDGYIPKPINTRDFLEYISGYFNGSHS